MVRRAAYCRFSTADFGSPCRSSYTDTDRISLNAHPSTLCAKRELSHYYPFFFLFVFASWTCKHGAALLVKRALYCRFSTNDSRSPCRSSYTDTNRILSAKEGNHYYQSKRFGLTWPRIELRHQALQADALPLHFAGRYPLLPFFFARPFGM